MAKKTTFTISKKENFSEWYTEILSRAEVVDVRYNVKGFVVIRPWGAQILEKMFRIYESALKRTSHSIAYFPTVIPEENFKKEAGHVEGFAPELFWLETKQGDDRLALRPTSETAMYQMYNLWIRSYRDLPLKLYQKGSVFRFDTKATRPLIRGREFYWIEAHDAFPSKKDAEGQVCEDIEISKAVIGDVFGLPYFSVRRPEWDKFPGAEYTIACDGVLPDGKLLQTATTHMLGQNFSKAFEVTFADEHEKKQFAYQTCYGPGFSRLLASILCIHGDDSGLVLPYALSPVQVVIIPHHSKSSSNKVMEVCQKISVQCFDERVDSTIDDSEKRPGEKFFYWEMKGAPFRVEIGEKELKNGEATVFIRDTREKVTLKLDTLVDDIKNLGAEYDVRLRLKAQNEFTDLVVLCKTKAAVTKALNSGKIARFDYCSIEKSGRDCAGYIEKDLTARIMGVREDVLEKPEGNCLFCSKKAGLVAYAGKSY